MLGTAEACLFSAIYKTLRVSSGAPLAEMILSLGWQRGAAYMVLLLSILFLQLVASFSLAMNGIFSAPFAARCHEAFSRGGTVLAIPHRLSSIRDAAQNLVIDGDQVTHENLLDADGPYAALWRREKHHCSLIPLPKP